MDAEPAARDELAGLGIRLVPAVAVGGRAVHGWNPDGYAALLGVAYRRQRRLSPAELAERLDRLLALTEALVAAVPADRLAFTPPERDRTIRDLGFHVFRLALAFPDAMDRDEFPEGWLQETAPAGMTTGAAIAAYGAGARRRLREWFRAAPPETWARVVPVYYGPQAAPELLERTAWHAAQHLRQLYDLAGRAGVTPPGPLPADVLADLPLPEALW